MNRRALVVAAAIVVARPAFAGQPAVSSEPAVKSETSVSSGKVAGSAPTAAKDSSAGSPAAVHGAVDSAKAEPRAAGAATASSSAPGVTDGVQQGGHETQRIVRSDGSGGNGRRHEAQAVRAVPADDAGVPLWACVTMMLLGVVVGFAGGRFLALGGGAVRGTAQRRNGENYGYDQARAPRSAALRDPHGGSQGWGAGRGEPSSTPGYAQERYGNQPRQAQTPPPPSWPSPASRSTANAAWRPTTSSRADALRTPSLESYAVQDGAIRAPSPSGAVTTPVSPPVAPPSPAPEQTYVPGPISAARTGNGPYAPALELFDRGYQHFYNTISSPEASARYPAVLRNAQQFDYLHQLLLQLSDFGSTEYETSLGDRVTVNTLEQWLEFMASTVLDPFSVTASELLLAGLDGDVAAQFVGEAYRDLLQYGVGEGLRTLGYDPVPAFPLVGMQVDTGTMRVVGTLRRPGFETQVVGVRQYGLVKGRAVVRQAHVMTG